MVHGKCRELAKVIFLDLDAHRVAAAALVYSAVAFNDSLNATRAFVSIIQWSPFDNAASAG